MDIWEVMEARHSVRQYEDKPIPAEIRAQLDECAKELNEKGGLHMQIIYDEPECFNSRMAHYGNFVNCKNYIAVVGKKSAHLDEDGGYYGELLVLKAQELGLNTCWVALTHGKSKASVQPGEKEVIIIALGYGQTQGAKRKSKAAETVSDIDASAPEWYKRGVEAALLAPTATNQQKFSFVRNGEKVKAQTPAIGMYLKVDLGIVKCHFELGSGKGSEVWA
ncbi:MAG: nitroreductase [Lachnospiraceae bacterium]|nr:nitroreductase [Lachnospiraceae bacterium]